MFYVLTDGDDNVVRYPYTLTDLKRDNPGTSFTKTVGNEAAAAFNCFPVTPTEPPAYDHTVNLERTAVLQSTEWVEQWISTPATPEEIQERTDNEANAVRQERDRLLEESDWTQLPDTPVDPAAWTTYRQDLRNVPQEAGFPWNVTWPTPPLT